MAAPLRADYAFLRRGSGRCLQTDDLRVLTASYATFSTQNNDVNQFSIVDHLGGLGATYCSALETQFDPLHYKADLQYAYDYLSLNGGRVRHAAHHPAHPRPPGGRQ